MIDEVLVIEDGFTVEPVGDEFPAFGDAVVEAADVLFVKAGIAL